MRSTTRRRRRFPLSVAIACVLPAAARIAAAQALTGALVGTVKDEQGAVLPGALVRVTSPALIGGPATTTTNERGQLRFPVLPPGPYLLEIELQGFATYHEEDVRIGAGATLERTAVLKLAGVAESIIVEGSGSRIEARGSGFETRFGPEYLRAIPTRRFSMFDAIRAAPGVSPTSPSSGTVNTVSAFGSGGNENLFLIDGTNFTCPCAGVSRAEPSVDVIQEIQVQSVGVSAEFGNIQGTVFNVLTRQGGDRFQYDASYFGQTSGLTSQPVLLPVAGRQSPSGYERARFRDFTTNLGGPVVRDRLWFFTGYQYLRDYDSQPGTDPAFPRTYEQNKIFAKLTWRLTPSLQLMQSVNDEFWVNPQSPTLVTPFEATQRLHASVPTMTFGHLTQTLSANTLWDVRVGRFVYSRNDDPSSGDPTTPNRFDRVTGVTSGDPPQIGGLTLIRTTVKATLSHYRPGLFAADHQWKVGTQIEKGEHDQPAVIPGGVRFVDDNGQPFQAISSPPSNSGGQFITAAAFASDALTIGERLTINAGVRFDHSRAISQDLEAIDAAGTRDGRDHPWPGHAVHLERRVATSGRHREAHRRRPDDPARELRPVQPGRVDRGDQPDSPRRDPDYHHGVRCGDRRLHAASSRLSIPRSTCCSIPRRGRRVPMNTRSAWIASCALDWPWRLAYIRKSGSNFIAWTDVGGQYREETRTLADGRTLPVFVLTNSTASRRFLLTNPDGYSLTYNGLVMVVEKRRSNGWQALASYTLSRAYGLQASSGATAADPQVSTVAPAFPTAMTFGRDPNSLTNADGRLPNDRPHMFRVMGTIDVPRTGFVVGANLQYFSGKPWAATTQISLPQGDQRILLEPRGSRRLSSQSLLDLRVSRTIRFGGVGTHRAAPGRAQCAQ